MRVKLSAALVAISMLRLQSLNVLQGSGKEKEDPLVGGKRRGHDDTG